jgi:hypothetical protein
MMEKSTSLALQLLMKPFVRLGFIPSTFRVELVAATSKHVYQNSILNRP